MPSRKEYTISALLLVLTVISTWYAGLQWSGVPIRTSSELWSALWQWRTGWNFAVPMMSILLAHEMGHFVAALAHRVPVSPPYFIPVPFFMFGTMGAVIRMRDTIRDRNALMDVAVAGPLAGLCVAVPVLIWGMFTSPVLPLPTQPGVTWLLEGRSIFYKAVLWLVHGDIPKGYDIMLSPTAMAGWAGLLVTMINLLPVGQLDGGHVGYALWGRPYNAIAQRLVKLLPWLALTVGIVEMISARRAPAQTASEPDWSELLSGLHWLIWWALLKFFMKADREDHPPTDLNSPPLTSVRRGVGMMTLIWFVLLFMPVWLKQVAS